MSITALSGTALEQSAANSFADYATSIPNLSFGQSGSGGGSDSRTIALRGIGGGGTTGVYIDNTPVPESLEPKVLDIARIEILRGPQGTLYGGRSQGGTVRFVTEQPNLTDASGTGHVSVSSTAHTDRPNYQIDGAINLPVIQDVFALRITGLHDNEAGYFKRAIGPYGAPPVRTIDNVANNISTGGSITGLIQVADNLTFTPRILYQRTTSNGLPYTDFPITDPQAPYILKAGDLTQRRDSDVREGFTDKTILATFDIEYKTAIGTFLSATSYFDRKSVDHENDSDFVSYALGIPTVDTDVVFYQGVENWTQEGRFTSDFNGPLQFVGGVFYSRQKSITDFPPQIIPGLDAASGGAFGTDNLFTYQFDSVQTEIAGYGEATLKVTDRLSLIGGVRVFNVKTDTSPVIQDGLAFGGFSVVPATKARESGVIPKASVQYKLSPDALFFVTAAKGFRPGGTNAPIPTALGCEAELESLGTSADEVGSYTSDSVWSYEVGAKTSMFDRRLTLNAGAFRIDWSKIQQNVLLQCGIGFTGNAGAARSQGFELELSARPAEGLSVAANFGYTSAKFTDDAPGSRFRSGDRVPQVPKVTASINALYSFAVTDSVGASLYADYKYTGSSTSATNAAVDAVTGDLIARIRPSYSLVDLRGTLSWREYELAIFARNALNERASLGDPFPYGFGYPLRGRIAINQPRTIGMELRARF